MSTISLKIFQVTTDRTVFGAVILFWSPQDGATSLVNTVAQTSGHQLMLMQSFSCEGDSRELLDSSRAKICADVPGNINIPKHQGATQH